MKKKVLIIDDEEDLVSMLGLRLQVSDFETVEAHSGEEGISKAKKEHPDIILLDLMMPGVDGFEVARRLHADSSTRKIPVLIFTAAVSSELAQKVKKLGVAGYVAKPFEPGILLKKIRKIIDSKPIKKEKMI